MPLQGGGCICTFAHAVNHTPHSTTFRPTECRSPHSSALPSSNAPCQTSSPASSSTGGAACLVSVLTFTASTGDRYAVPSSTAWIMLTPFPPSPIQQTCFLGSKLDSQALQARWVRYDSDRTHAHRIYWPGKNSITVEPDVKLVSPTINTLPPSYASTMTPAQAPPAPAPAAPAQPPAVQAPQACTRRSKCSTKSDDSVTYRQYERQA
jgi:hypothetical protein